MATANTVIGRALRLLQVVAAGETIEAGIASDALGTLNVMLAEWHEAGIGYPDYSLANVATELDGDAADVDALAYQLAIRLAPEYGMELSPLVMRQAAHSMLRLRGRYMQAAHPVTADYF